MREEKEKLSVRVMAVRALLAAAALLIAERVLDEAVLAVDDVLKDGLIEHIIAALTG